MMSFWKCAISTELPGHVATGTLLGLIFAIKRYQRERTPLTAVTPLLLVAALIPLAKMFRRQLVTRAEFTRALQAAGVPTPLTQKDLSLTSMLTLLLPTSRWLSRGVTVLRALVFDTAPKKVPRIDGASVTTRGTGEGVGGSGDAALETASVTVPLGHTHEDSHTPSSPVRKLKLDLYWSAAAMRRTRRRGGAPILLYVHGGGWVIGHRSFASLSLLNAVAQDGWLVATCNYRLAPSVHFPHMLHDVKAAVAWLRTHGGVFGGDTSFVAVGGESAGGHLALLTGLTAGVPSLQRSSSSSAGPASFPPPDHHHRASSTGEASTGGRGDVESGAQGSSDAASSCHVDAVVDLYGVADWTDSGLQYSARARQGGRSDIFRLLEKLVVQRPFASAPLDFVRGSPYWWLWGSELLPRLAATGLPPLVQLAQGGGGGGALESSAALLAEMQDDSRVVPPLMIVHGTADTLVPIDDSRRLWDALKRRRERGKTTSRDDEGSSGSLDVMVECEGAHHAFNYIPSARTLALGDAVCDWLDHVHARTVEARLVQGGRAPRL